MLSNMVKWLEYSYIVLNRVLFSDKLPEVVITIQSSERAYAHITTKKIWRNGDEYYYEINLGAEHLNREKINLLCSLVHEMSHLWNMEQGINDCSNRGRYHNSSFKKTAEEIGMLKIDYDSSIGWSSTSPTEGFVKVVAENGLDSIDINIYRTKYGEGEAVVVVGGNGKEGGDTEGGNDTSSKKKGSTRNYECPCGYKVRSTKDMTDKIICAECGGYYVEVTKNKDK